MGMVKSLSLLLLLLVFSGCLSEEKPLRVAISPWIGYESLYQAKDFDWLDKSIELLKVDLPSESFKKITRGEVDAATMTMEDVILARTQGVELVIVAVLDISAGADVILSKNTMSSLADIKGKRIGHESSALASLMLTATLARAGLQYNDVTTLEVPPTQQSQAWQDDTVDIVITYEPYASELIDLGANEIISSREFPEMIFDVLVVRADRLEGREQGIQRLLQSHFRALEYFRSNYKDTLYRIAARQGTSIDDVKRALGGVVLPSKQANKTFFRKDSNLYRSAEILNTLMLEKGVIIHKDTLNGFADPVFLKE